MKLRLTLADLLAEVRDLRSSILGQRLVNVYDAATPGEIGTASKTTFLLKFTEPGREKAIVVVESGIRVHTTRYARDKPTLPGGFAMKLRKHVRGRRCSKVALRGLDRVLDLAFGTGSAEHHIFVELYDRGNVILTDADYTILALLRGYVLGGGDSIPPPLAAAAAAASASASATALASKPGPGFIKTKKQHAGAKAAAVARDAAAALVPVDSSTTDGPARVRVAVRERYVLLGKEDATANLVSRAHANICSSITDIVFGGRGSVVGGMDLEADIEIETAVTVTSAVAAETAAATAAATVAAGASTRILPVVDATHVSTEVVALAILALVDDYVHSVLPGLNSKARKKARLVTALTQKGTGLDLLGPVLIEHAAVAADLPKGGDAPLDSLGATTAGEGGVQWPTAAALRFAAHVRTLPYVFASLARGAPTAIVLLERIDPADDAKVGAGADAIVARLRIGGGGGGVKKTRVKSYPLPPPQTAVSVTGLHLRNVLRHFHEPPHTSS